MRRRLFLVGLLLLTFVLVPMLRHASVPSPTSRDASINHAPRSAPGIARIAAMPIVTTEVPQLVVVAVTAPVRTPAGTPLPPALRPVIPLRL